MRPRPSARGGNKSTANQANDPPSPSPERPTPTRTTRRYTGQWPSPPGAVQSPLVEDDTRILVDKAMQGDGAAVEELLRRHLPGLRAFIRLRSSPIVRAKESASDLAQSVCREVLQNFEQFQYGNEAGFRHWLFTTALRRIQKKHDYWTTQKRDAGRETPKLDAEGLDVAYRSLSSPSGRAMAAEQLERIENAFDELDEDEREVIVLARIVGLSHREIADKLGKSEGATRTQLYRALARLANLIDAE